MSAQWRAKVLCGLMGWGWLWAPSVLAAPADEPIPIERITVNPMANNRRAVILQGKVKHVMVYTGQDGLGRAICGHGFVLADDTGSIDALYVVRCHAGEDPTGVTDGEHVVVYATIDVSSDFSKRTEGGEVSLKAMVTKVVRGK